MPSRKSKPSIDQGHLFTGFKEREPERNLVALINGINPPVPYMEKPRLTQAYLRTLKRFNDRLKSGNREPEDLEHDNLFLRLIFGGIQNSYGTPAELFGWLNTAEKLLGVAGVFKRKYIGDREVAVNTTDVHGHYQEPIKIILNPARHEISRIAGDGHLDGKPLFYIVNHLLTQPSLAPIYHEHKRFWRSNAGRSDIPQIREFYRMNPYDPDSLQERMGYIEAAMPYVPERFKEELSKPFIPERIMEHKGHGNFGVKKHPEGFKTPGKTYRRGVVGRSFYRLDEYEREVAKYFEMKEMQLKKAI